ncbi:MAG: cobalt transporter CbiM [Spirochaetes bacterium]|nr:cobalt transporter CbiM [Spirochaetota bacterium]
MHIPDNYLSPQTCAVMGAVMVPVWTVAVKKVKEELSPEKVPVIGILAAFSFLIMMFNIPLPGGTTGHAVGGTLVAILVGPWSACIAVTVALLIQALFFGDGGILAFGANAFNMAFVLPFVGFYLFVLLKKIFKGNTGAYMSAFIASYAGLNLAAFATAVEFGIQPLFFKDIAGLPMYCPYALNISIPAMMIPHLLAAGFVEAIATAGVYAYIAHVSPGIIYGRNEPVKIPPLYALILIMAALAPLGLLAAGTAWGEWGADEIKRLTGYIPQAMGKGFSFNALFPDYTVPGVKHDILAYIISALFGAAVLMVLFKLIAGLVTARAHRAKK